MVNFWPLTGVWRECATLNGAGERSGARPNGEGLCGLRAGRLPVEYRILLWQGRARGNGGRAHGVVPLSFRLPGPVAGSAAAGIPRGQRSQQRRVACLVAGLVSGCAGGFSYAVLGIEAD